VALLIILLLPVKIGEPLQAQLVGLEYEGESSSTGMGMGVAHSSDGGVSMVPVVVSSHDDEDWIAVFETDGEYTSIEVEPEFYYSAKIGETHCIKPYKNIFGLTVTWGLCD